MDSDPFIQKQPGLMSVCEAKGYFSEGFIKEF